MSRIQRFFFHLCMFLSVSAMIYGHVLIITSGRWFIPGKEKYNVFTRWVSDFAAVWPQGLWIKASIILFCVALLIFKLAKQQSCGVGALGHARWFWNALLTFGLIAGLLLVALYDMSPPQFTTKDPSWLGKLLGKPPEIIRLPDGSIKEIQKWHHEIGFQMFIFSFAAMLLTAAVEKFRIKDAAGLRRDALFVILTAVFMLWLFACKDSLAGIPQRVLLVLIFWWVWREGAALGKPPLRGRNSQPRSEMRSAT